MSEKKETLNDAPLPRFDRPRLDRPRFGVDAPSFPAVTAALGTTSLVASGRWRKGRVATAATGAVLLASTGAYLHTTLRGKLRVWEQELDRIGLKGHEQLLDLGCGRGAVLVAAARRLPEGRAVGADLWLGKDQSGNTPDATRANAFAAGVLDRVEVHTADITALPFADGSFDVVTSALVIHNIPADGDRCRALDEAVRVLRPGGRLVIADFGFAARKYARHLERAHRGQPTLRPLGAAYWYGGPWLAVTLLELVKER